MPDSGNIEWWTILGLIGTQRQEEMDEVLLWKDKGINP